MSSKVLPYFGNPWVRYTFRSPADPNLRLSCKWVYAISGLLVRALVSLRLGAVFLRDRLNVEDKPLSALGFVAGAVGALGWWRIWLVSWLKGGN